VKKSKRNSFKLNPIAASIVLAMASQLPVNVANAGSGWGNGISATGSPVNPQTYYANSPSGQAPVWAVGASGVVTTSTNATTGLINQADSGKALRKFVDTLPGFGSTNANDLGQYIPVAVPVKWVDLNGNTTTDDYYEIAAVEFAEKMHSDLPKATHLRGYVQIATAASIAAAKIADPKYAGPYFPTSDGTSTGVALVGVPSTVQFLYPPHHLGPIISATKGTAVRVKFTNYLPVGTAGNLFLPVDTTITGAGAGTAVDASGNPVNYTQNRAEIHLVGGQTPWISAGSPHQWIAPAGETTPYPKGASQQNVPDMADPGPGSATLYFPNDMSARFTFFEDRSSGITRLNTYSGLEAAYKVTDSVEQGLITAGTIPAAEIPLIIEDKTFVPVNVVQQDALWDTTHWGQPGDLWFPHVYEPNQDPNIANGANPVGRWDYGPHFWPIFEATQPLPSGGYGNATFVPESYEDTPVINGTAYPTLTVDPKAYRFRILNASNDRFLNLGLYKAKADFALDASGNPILTQPTAPQLDQNGNPIVNAAGAIQYFSGTEVNMVPAVADVNGNPLTPPVGAAGAVYPLYDPTCLCQYATLPQLQPTITFSGPTRAWPIDGRVGGAPDPKTVGPDFIQIGTDGGFLPHPVDIPAQPVTYESNRRSVTVTNVYGYGLLVSPSERADVIVDFSAYAGQTLILYNDAPAPFPFNDQRVDYFTGDGDQTGSGGAYNTLPGYGPNTRTIMQIKVNAGVNGTTTPAPAFNATPLLTAIPAAYAASQPAPIVAESAYNAAFGTTDTDNYGRVATGSAAQPTLDFTTTGQLTLTGINVVSSTGAGSGSGSGYLTAPLVNITGGLSATGVAATAHSVLNAAGQVGSVVIDTYGSGYVAAPTITFTPVPAVTAITVGDGGSGYTTPVVTLSAPTLAGGVQATATASILSTGSGILPNVTINSSGSGYTTAPVVTFTGGGGSGAAGLATVSTSALATTTSVTAGGVGYTAPVVALTPSQTGGVNATATVSIASSISPTLAITAGTGLDPATTSITISAPQVGTNGATATVTVDSNSQSPTYQQVIGYTVTNVGAGYTSAPTVTITDYYGNATATATASIAAGTGVVTGLTINNVGSGYTSAPIATITDSTGKGAIATTSLAGTAGTVTSVVITNTGTGYTTAPTVGLTQTGATAANVSVALATAPGAITSIKVTNPGSGYTTVPTVTISDAANTGYGASATAAIATAGVGAQATVSSTRTVSIPALTKAEQELFDANGRYNSTGGSELPYTTANIQTTVPLQYVDTPTEIIGENEAQIWKLVDNGFWSNSIHFDLNDVQLINRVGWDGTVKAPSSAEVGWKDTLRLNPLEDVIVAIRAHTPKVPFGQPQSTRLQDPSIANGAAGIALAAGVPAPARFTADPNVLNIVAVPGVNVINPATPLVAPTNPTLIPNLPLLTTAVNTAVVNGSLSVVTSTPGVGNGNFDNEFLWGTAVLGHSEDDFQRPVVFNPQVVIPAAASGLADATGSGTLTWTDPTPAANAQNFQNEIGFQILQAPVANGAPSGPFVQVATVPANQTSWSSASISKAVPPVSVPGAYEVVGYNAAGVSSPSNIVIEGIPTAPNLLTLTPSFITPATTTSDVSLTATWQDNAINETNYVETRSLLVNGVVTGTPLVTTSPANPNPPSTTTTWVDPNPLVEQSFYRYDIVAKNSFGTSTPVLSGTIQAPISVPLAPAAPVNAILVAQTTKAANVNLSWTNLAFNQTGYSITRTGINTATGLSGGGAFVPVTNLAANTTSYVDTTAQEGFTYTYSVCATNTSLAGAVQSGCTSTAAIPSPITVPLQPTDLTATAVTAPLDSNGLYPDVVTLTWTDKAFNETSYEVLRGGVVIGTLGSVAGTGTAMTFTDQTPPPGNLLDGHAYSYTVAAVNTVNPSAAGVLAQSNTAAITMPGLALPAPTNVVATANRNGAFIGLTWTNPASTTALPITGVLIQEQVTTPATATTPAVVGAWVNATPILRAGTTTFNRAAAVVGNIYNFRLAETNVAKFSDSAYTYIASTLTSPAAPVAPAFTTTAPVPNATNGTVALTWNAITPITGTTMTYNVNITVNGVTTTLNTNRTNYTFRPTAAQVGTGATFNITVQAVQTATRVVGATLFGSGTSVASAPATVTLTPATAPAALASVTATVASATTTTLSWTDNTTTETSYLVTILNNTTGVTTTATVNRTAAQTTSTGTAVTYTAATVVGDSYTFSVVAQNTKYGVTANSAAVSASVTVPTVPAAPATITAVAGATGTRSAIITLPGVAGVTYTIQRATVTAGVVGAYANVVTTAAGATTYTNTGLTAARVYQYRVSANNVVGSSAFTLATTTVTAK